MIMESWNILEIQEKYIQIIILKRQIYHFMV